MISESLISILTADSTLMNAVGGAEYVSAEVANGDQYVLILDNNKARVNDNIPEFKQSDIQLLISGYKVLEGEKIGILASNLIEGLTGEAITSGDYTYTVQSVIVRGDPVLIEWEKIKGFSVNLTMYYKEELTS